MAAINENGFSLADQSSLSDPSNYMAGNNNDNKNKNNGVNGVNGQHSSSPVFDAGWPSSVSHTNLATSAPLSPDSCASLLASQNPALFPSPSSLTPPPISPPAAASYSSMASFISYVFYVLLQVIPATLYWVITFTTITLPTWLFTLFSMSLTFTMNFTTL